MNIALKLLSTSLTIAVFVIACYILSVWWRVSNVEQSIFGSGALMPLAPQQQQFDQPPTPESYGKNTYTHMVRGQPTQVYEQLLNSFQHLYGSALMSYEIGELGAVVIFNTNEYLKAIFSSDSGTHSFYLDTKKDLANNEVGRKIGSEVKTRGLVGPAAEQFMIDGGLAYKNCSEYRVTKLPSLNENGCPLLINIQELRRSDKSVVLR